VLEEICGLRFWMECRKKSPAPSHGKQQFQQLLELLHALVSCAILSSALFRPLTDVKSLCRSFRICFRARAEFDSSRTGVEGTAGASTLAACTTAATGAAQSAEAVVATEPTAIWRNIQNPAYEGTAVPASFDQNHLFRAAADVPLYAAFSEQGNHPTL
jgi:hypothetical protein